jgi:hypothetical protein
MWLFPLFLLACSEPPGAAVDDTANGESDADVDTGADTGTEPSRTACVDGTWPQEAEPDGSVRVTTDHYDLTVDAAADPQDFARLVEAAWMAWSEDVGAEPADRLELVLFPDQDSWVAGLAERGIAAPVGAGGYYDPGTGLASLFRQPTLYFTEMLFLHEAFHQFHLRARSGTSTLPSWYVEGLAEWTSRHDWDGRCVRIGADPRATWEDYWAQVAGETDGSDLAAWVRADTFPDRPAMMSFVHFMAGERSADWHAFRQAEDAGARADLDVAGLDDAWAAHVRANQEPLTPLWLDCLHRSPDTLRELSFGGIAAVRWKETPLHLEVEIPVVPGGYSGGLIGWSEEGFDVIWIDEGGGVSRWVLTSGRNDWFGLGSIPTPGATVLWVQEGTSVSLDGEAFDFDPVLPEAAGHAVYGGTGDFVTIQASQ